MRNLPLAILTFALGACAGDIGPESVWKDGPKLLPDIVKACDSASEFPACFARQLTEKAPPAALAFARSMKYEAWMRDFRAAGRVSVAKLVYQFRANENNGWLFVNGSPALFDPDDFKRLESATHGDPEWARLTARYPKAMLFPGDRSGAVGPLAILHSDGAQEFIADYFVMDGCHACAVLGNAYFSFEFNAKGKFTAARFLGFETEPVWLVRTRTGQRFTLRLGCEGACSWTEAQPPANHIIRLAAGKDDGIDCDVVGSGATQASLRSGSGAVVIRFSAAPGLRR